MRALELLARARIEAIPAGFNGDALLTTIRDWRDQLKELEAGPNPPPSALRALRSVNSAARRLAAKLATLEQEIAGSTSRIRYSGFTGPWPLERLEVMRRDLEDLAAASGTRDVVEAMRRPDIGRRKPKDGWSAREALFGYDLPTLYRDLFGRCFTASGKDDLYPSEGHRFATVVAAEVLGHDVTPGNVVKQRTVYRDARGRNRRHK